LFRALLAAGRQEEASAALRRAAELEPNHWETCQLQGLMAFVNEDIETAQAHVCRALEANSRDATSHMLLAALLMQQGQLAEAREHARLTLRCDPREGQAKSARRMILQINEQIGADLGQN